ncbi:hypothetical protein [Acinetobacter sp. ANC 4648]|uniref:hypothetical protein n=1 Tax=Acinetobacter sp. ANC 4648 TaxID=1977875 RepID=UPI000B57FEE9|nr:hypothetical protein [Acinetobacter sp. ANC 4648]OTG81654.1 hypothetical protein B9T27_10305 [Acinetobacter sp. ANC 4648]
MSYKTIILCTSLLSLVGCQARPTQTHTSLKAYQTSETKQQAVATPDGVKITPYTQAEIKREKIPVITP